VNSENGLSIATPALFAMSASRDTWRLAPHLSLIDELLIDAARGGERICLSMPPRHGKSELVDRWFPAWLLGTFPERRVMLASYEADFAATWGAKARDALEQHGALFGVRVRDDSSARHRWDIAGHAGGMVTAGVGGPLTGRGADVLIIDDPVKNAEEANSDTYRERAWDWFRSVAMTRLEPDASVIIVATRWHQDDLIGRLTREEPDRWRVVNLPAIAEDADELGRAPGDALWPDRFPLQALEATRASIGSYWWNAMYQGRPTPLSGDVFKRDWFRTFDLFETAYRVDGELIPVDRCRRFSTVDLAVSTKTSADWTVIAAWALTPDRDLLLLDLERRRLEGPDIVPALQATHSRWRPNFMGVERVAFQAVIVQAAQRAGLPIRELRADKDKITRALPAAARMEGGGVYWRSGAQWIGELEAELVAFPHGRHDDQVDALAYAVEQVTTGAVGSPAKIDRAPDTPLPRPSGVTMGRRDSQAEADYQRAAEFWR
jgi:predicted phage terminase large subunit-like protein